MAILSKACKPDNFKLHDSLKLSLTNIWGLRLNFVGCESFLESNSPDIRALCETNLDNSIDSVNFSVSGYLPSISRILVLNEWMNLNIFHNSKSQNHLLKVSVKSKINFLQFTNMRLFLTANEVTGSNTYFDVSYRKHFFTNWFFKRSLVC